MNRTMLQTQVAVTGSMGSVVGEEVEIDGSIMEGGGQILRMSVCSKD